MTDPNVQNAASAQFRIFAYLLSIPQTDKTILSEAGLDILTRICRMADNSVCRNWLISCCLRNGIHIFSVKKSSELPEPFRQRYVKLCLFWVHHKGNINLSKNLMAELVGFII
jgi:hypothetical protein